MRGADAVDRKLKNSVTYVKTELAMPTPASCWASSRPTKAVSQADSRGSMSSVPSAGTARVAMAAFTLGSSAAGAVLLVLLLPADGQPPSARRRTL